MPEPGRVSGEQDIRIDKWLWAVRVFKTRNSATEACRMGRVRINDQSVKPSRPVRAGEVITVRKAPVLHAYRVKGLLSKRLSARLVTDYMEDITPESELKKLTVKDDFFVQREKGSGRPTKADRRAIEKLSGYVPPVSFRIVDGTVVLRLIFVHAFNIGLVPSGIRRIKKPFFLE